MRKLLITYCLMLFVAITAYAQVATGLPYERSFEPGEDLSAWAMNEGSASAEDQWMIGQGAHSEGRRAMYISCNNADPVYGAKPNIVVTYLRYKFPSKGHYDLSFDWKGVGDSTKSKLYLLHCPEVAFRDPNSPEYIGNIVASSTRRAELAPDVVAACDTLNDAQHPFLCGSETWQNISTEISISATLAQGTYVIAFIWVNDNRDTAVHNSSIAIDNLQITTATIPKPKNVQGIPQCEDSTLLVTWESSAMNFDVEYRKIGEGWHQFHDVQDGYEGFTKNGSQCSYVLERILEGTYDVRVRAMSITQDQTDTLRTGWSYETLILVYCPDNHCINYVNLDGPNVVCTYGMHEYHTGETPYDHIGKLDFGPDSDKSRHTIHRDPNELDPRADSLLHTVPPGALASVRLGNWNASGKAQSITYTMTVDTATQGILIMKYAAVLDNSGHDRDQEPYIRIEVLDQNNNPLGGLCGKADFAYSDAVEQQDLESWHLTTYQGEQLAWKDWTTVGLDLMQYHGQTIKVRITTADCGQTVHYGYGYFTLDCANAHIETNNCGNDASITCSAPEGFAYAWYDEQGQLKSTDRELNIDASRQTYTCRVSMIEESSCYFEMKTLAAPRFPVPAFEVEHKPHDCINFLKFTNKSHVMNKFEGWEDHTAEECNDVYEWTFRRLSDGHTTYSSAKHPQVGGMQYNAGDSIWVSLTAFLGAENACDSTFDTIVYMPNIVPDTTEFYYSTCPENAIKFDDQWFNTDTLYVARYTNDAGCDSISILRLDVFPEVKDIYRHDSICSDQSLIINGVTYNQPLENHLIMLKTIHDCDSAMYLTLTVNKRIKANLDTMPYSCADEQNLYLPLTIQEGVFDSLVIVFSTPELRDTVIYDPTVTEVNIPFAADITPGHYTVTFSFYQFCCGTHVVTRGIDVRYRSSIVEQKWNDVLTLLSPKYNGGFEFTAYQWYKDGLPILGENNSYLYQPLDLNSTYYVELTRADGVVIATCPIQPEYHEQQTPFPTIVTAGQHVPMYMAQPTTVWYYTMAGQFYTSFGMQQGYTDLMTPAQPGVYIVKSVNAEGETKAQTMIVE